MDKTLGYIFGSLQVSEAAIGGIIKELKTQNRINKLMGLALLLNAIVVWGAAEHCLENKKKIEALTKEIKEMKKLKGE